MNNDESICFMCRANLDRHTPADGHPFWSVADAFAQADKHDKRAQTNVESRYVSQHRPY